MPDDSCICCVRPFHQSSDAKIVQLTAECSLPEHALENGFEYFLEKDGIEELPGYAEGKLKSREAKTEFIVYYAEFDAYPAWFNELCAE